MELAHDEMGAIAASGVSSRLPGRSTYPAQLKQIYDPPLILYVRGNVDAITQPGIAVVGTRHPTPYGLGMADDWRVIWPTEDWSFLVVWRAAWTRPRIAARSMPKGKR